ncbi:2,3-diaminopropionate biosynthesis protein SbnA [Chitinophaga rhizophila]|uniref:2,3-diaminopropionate biosynthesis protein SbnA n=1 Tax=Chitinophaga rhizophila TaxID=2866212 RepID=A0ABS7GKB8_9BACT|nr:2,3-diaminopropionate biosynthesis protein SbnA [Chitinophaga rhizophila]MBW8687194.1 2,3-diaminopropionate biosynthesis protein SbnA [Chitinophaga rhizophila]
MTLLSAIEKIEQRIGNTPCIQLENSGCNLFAKLEFENFMGSVKDRSACYILKSAIKKNLIRPETVVIESSSGNFGIALAAICRKLNLRFIPIIDANTADEKEKLMRLLSYNVIKVTHRDSSGGFLLNRLAILKELLAAYPGSYHPNQYENEDNFLSYYHSLGKEICDRFTELDYAFISVSTGGTITGVSRRLKEKFPNIRIIGVDVEGSMVFQNKPCVRHLSGIGSSQHSTMIRSAEIDDYMILPEEEIIEGCQQLLQQEMIFGGASTGAVYAAARKYLHEHGHECKPALIICPDKGNAYLDTVYNTSWVEKTIHSSNKLIHEIS